MDESDHRGREALRARGLLPALAPSVLVVPDERADLRAAYRGALVGTAIGDALGRPAEGRSPQLLVERYGRLRDYQPWRGWEGGPRGTITDDTQLTMCVGESLLAGDGRLDPVDLAQRFVDWFPRGRGKGRTCTVALLSLMDGVPWWEAGDASAGNGAAMRAAPVGLVHLHDTTAMVEDAALSAVLTHADPMAVASAAAHAFTVAHLAATEPGRLDTAQLMGELSQVLSTVDDPGYRERDWQTRPGKTAEPVRLADRLAEVPIRLDHSPVEAFDWFYNGAFVLESLPAALWCFLRSPDEPEEVVVTAVMGGHDADTVASLAGAYVGAYLGEPAFPERWRGEDLEFGDELRSMGDGLLALALAGRERP
ncbi:MAG: ADP-ribosyl-[dinitrogen reductase] glycohydrolase [Acidimicrobiales bacterium]|nr:MAG: hypothetical protein EDR02_10015 [Actinomycetota bacterium]MBV6509404.1 ADP-ribosyl-[dinitrogen reductase] glycohydrolase [Acidimicrobiales bacterium]RIK06727.1 MAG: hypothetical protein DCC48_05745 [Acidobacteriota bacterium]